MFFVSENEKVAYLNLKEYKQQTIESSYNEPIKVLDIEAVGHIATNGESIVVLTTTGFLYRTLPSS